MNKGFVGFFSNGTTKGVWQNSNPELKNLGLHVIEFFLRLDYTALEQKSKTWMEVATKDADISSVFYTSPPVDLNWLLEHDPDAFDKLEIQQDGEVVSDWKSLRQFLELNDPLATFKVNKDWSKLIYYYCRYGYILNLDTREIEIYEGNNHDPNQAGRYVHVPDEVIHEAIEDPHSGLGEAGTSQAALPSCGARLIMSIPVEVLREMSCDERKELMVCMHTLLAKQTERRKNQ